jgi:Uma2 family endonuclease
MEIHSMSQATTLPITTIQEAAVDNDSLYEIVDGQRVEKPLMGSFQVLVASILDQQLGAFVRTNGLGRVLSEMLFKINPTGGHKRRPDVAFVSYERWARGRKINSEDGWDVIPDLAIEVISPSNTAEEVIKKIREYFKAKVRQVWVVYPIDRLIYVYDSPKKNIILDITDELDGGTILPGFRLSLVELFEDGEEV